MNNQEAHELRDEIARAIHIRRCCDSENDGWPFYRDHAEAVLPIVTQREAALRERLELAEENTAEGADEAVRRAQTMAFTAQRNLAAILIERDQLVEKINALADELDAKALSAGDAERATHDVGAFGDEMVYQREKRVLTYAVRRLRGLVSGDNQAQR